MPANLADNLSDEERSLLDTMLDAYANGGVMGCGGVYEEAAISLEKKGYVTRYIGDVFILTAQGIAEHEARLSGVSPGGIDRDG